MPVQDLQISSIPAHSMYLYDSVMIKSDAYFSNIIASGTTAIPKMNEMAIRKRNKQYNSASFFTGIYNASFI
mgnify:CR=1 FL=1